MLVVNTKKNYFLNIKNLGINEKYNYRLKKEPPRISKASQEFRKDYKSNLYYTFLLINYSGENILTMLSNELGSRVFEMTARVIALDIFPFWMRSI
jgi:hypothetical protein